MIDTADDDAAADSVSNFFGMRLLLGGGSMRMGLIPCVGFGDVCLSVLRVTCGSVILVASWICDTCVHL